MPAPTAENLVSLFRSAARLTFKRSSTSAAAKKKPSSAGAAAKKKPSSSSSADDAALKAYVSAINSSSAVSESAKCLLKSFKRTPSPTVSTSPNSSLHSIVSDSLNSGRRDGDDESAKQLSTDASSILYDEMDLDWDDEYEDEESLGNMLDLPWLSRMSFSNMSLRRKIVSRERKQKWVFKNTYSSRFSRLVNMCAKKLGSDATIAVFGRLGRETGPKEYNALINICIEKARNTTDEDVALEQIYKAYQIFKLVRETGFKIEEETYGQFLMYLIDFEMVDEFFFFHELIKEENPDSLPRLAYYEMLLWIRVNNEAKIQALCQSVVADDAEEKSYLQESLLLALCESDRKEEFLMLLGTFDITKVQSVASLVCVFRSLGKLLLEPFAERFLLELKRSDIFPNVQVWYFCSSTDTGAENISNLICEYAISIPNFAVEEIIIKFHEIHTKLEVSPSSAQYEKLIKYSCEFFKVHEALNVMDEALGSGIALSLETLHSILDACDRSCEFNLVHQIYSRISHHNLKPNNETFRRMILLCVKMKDFEGAYGMIDDLQEMNLKPTTGMYNTILSGYFREKNIVSAKNVLKQMEDVDVKPDALTFSYLIGNSQCEKDIIKFYDMMNDSGVQPSKHVFMALINAYASWGKFDKAKQVLLEKRIPVKHLNEIKSVLVGALASNGHFSDALKMYEEIKEAECDLDPKAIKCLIEYFHSEGDLNKSLQLLEELNDSPYWTDACFRVISHCVQHKDLRSTVDLLKQLKDKFINAEVAPEVLFDEVFCLFAEKESTDMKFGLDLLQAIKEELGIQPSRKSLDFLLSACVNAKDSKSSFLVWQEYEKAGLPYNVLSFVRMYQALLASGNGKSAAKILNKIPKGDPHVRCVIKACEETYMKSSESVETKQQKRKKALVATLGLLDGLEAKTE
ncbi:hypothetical protein BUALT_Bualt18G0061700 [Buddleja alternifolia]|uniref:PROP1-like PPR domain-containing protein n=1 Tax=Buddleja alternifolia TaxID=168488 RepID=A0AAV6WAV9_9LAMI|nr:hypothetical protein BUALT_Bualt18G0061700 [Buddleja alternifolia]